MPPRQARRSRRRSVPASSLPRPLATEPGAELDEVVDAPLPPVTTARMTPSRRALGPRAHHVQEDLSYVRTDLIGIAIVSAVAVAFVVGMSFVL